MRTQLNTVSHERVLIAIKWEKKAKLNFIYLLLESLARGLQLNTVSYEQVLIANKQKKKQK